MCGISLGFEEKRGLVVTLSSEILVDPEEKKNGKGHSSTIQTNINLYMFRATFLVKKIANFFFDERGFF